MKFAIHKLYLIIRNWFFRIKFANGPKVFCIGRNKTGTTSMAALFEELGFFVAPQRPGELLIKDWAKSEFRQIIKFVKYGGQAFQDIPFSLPETYKVLDMEFPQSKFILTVRDSPETWYNSFTSFHSKLFGNGNIPTVENLKNASYVYPGWVWEVNRSVYRTIPEGDPYNKELLMSHYVDYNSKVINYFKDKPNKLLVINLKDKDSGAEIAKFLGVQRSTVEIPWENKT